MTENVSPRRQPLFPRKTSTEEIEANLPPASECFTSDHKAITPNPLGCGSGSQSTVEISEKTCASRSAANAGSTDRILPVKLGEISSARNKFYESAEPKFEEGPPRRLDPAIQMFKADVAEAQAIEGKISDAEARLDQTVDELRTEQILRAFRASKLIAEGHIPRETVTNLLAEAGVKPHGNTKIACAALMRAIVLLPESKGSPRYDRKRQRATTYASAIDCALHEHMSAEEFEAELRHPPTPGESHGIEALAERGRTTRQRSSAGGQLEFSLPDLPLTISGDVSDVDPGVHLMLAKVENGSAVGALLQVPVALIRRAILADAKSRRADDSS